MISHTRKIVEDPEQPGELLLDLGNELCDELGWKTGDVIEWHDNQDGTWTLRKQIHDSTNSDKH